MYIVENPSMLESYSMNPWFSICVIWINIELELLEMAVEAIKHDG